MSNEEKVRNILKAAEALPFLFIGSGFSMRYLGSDNWERLLRRFASKIQSSPYRFEKSREQAKQSILAEGKDPESIALLYPRIADFIEADFNTLWYDAEEYAESREKFSDLIQKGVSPLKIELAEYCASIEDNDLLLPQEIEWLYELSSRSIAGIITTNYDCFLEWMFPDFVPYVGQDELVFSTPQSISEIYKVHGCCKKPETIVFNSRDYAEFDRKNAYLAAKLLTTFVEHPIIFLGYSIQDENVRKILEAISDCLGDKLSVLKDRLIFVEWVEGKSSMEVSTYSKDFGKGKFLEMTKVSLSDFCEFYRILSENKSKYPTKLLRQIKQDIYSLTLTTDPKTRLVALNTSRSPSEGEEVEYVVGFGVLEIGKRGYQTVTAEEVYLDIVFDNANFINELMVEHSLPTLMSFCGANNLPVYKYISNYSKPLPEKYRRFAERKFSDFSTSTLRQLAGRSLYHSVEEVIADRYLSLANKLNYIAALKENEINVETLRSFLMDLFERVPNVLQNGTLKSPTKKLIRIYDFLKYKK